MIEKYQATVFMSFFFDFDPGPEFFKISAEDGLISNFAPKIKIFYEDLKDKFR